MEFKTNFNNNNNSQEQNLPYEKLSFKRSFWIILIAIAIVQIYNFSLAAYYGMDFKSFPSSFYLYFELGNIFWFIVLLTIVIYDLYHQNIAPLKVLNFDFTIIKKQAIPILKYFAGCAAFIVFISFLNRGETELKLEYRTSLTLFLSFLTTVILAPICEEIAFRGYLYSAMFTSFKRKKERLVVNAMLFACAHVFLAEFLIGARIPYYIFILGYLLAKLYEESRSVVPCILLHSLNNSFVFGIDIIKTYY